MVGKKVFREIAVAIVLLVLATMACGPLGGGEAGPSVTITAPPSGTTVQVGDEVEIVSTAAADKGVARVELLINGQVVRTDTPPEGNPTTFTISQPWTPVAAGEVTVSVVVYDTEGQASEPAAITLRVEAAVAEITPTPVEDVAGPGGCTLNASLVKTWRLRNSGTCDWGPGFKLVFVGGDAMGGPAQVDVPPTAAGSTVDVSVNLVAPSSPGTYRGDWRMQSDTGLLFGTTVYVRIVVPEPTEEPTEEATEESPFAGKPLKVGLLTDQSGLLAIYGPMQERGFRLGLEYATDGTMEVAGRPIEVIVRDNGSDPEKAVADARELIEAEGVEILVGTVSSPVSYTHLTLPTKA